jgi:hypothetical protein
MRVVNKVEYTKYRQGLSIVLRKSPLQGLRERKKLVTATRWKMGIGSLVCLLVAAGAARAQETSAPVLRRVLLAPPPAPSAATQQWIAAQRAAATQSQRRGGLFGFFSPRKSAPKTPQAVADKKKGAVEKTVPLPEATPEQLHALSEALLYQDLAEKLRIQRHLILPTDAEVQSALTTLHLTLASLRNSDTARRLGRELDCDAVLIPDLTHLERNEGSALSVTLRGTLHVVQTAPSDRVGRPRAGKRRQRGPSGFPATSAFFGTAAAEHVMFHDSYRRTAAQLAMEAAQQAAAGAAHAFWTGEIAPFARAEDRIALLPVPAPADADALLFTPEGRHVATAAVRALPTDLAAQFQPEIAPLHGKEVVAAESARAMLKQEGITVEALWRQDQPEVARVQALGARLEVSYVLMAHITEVELQTGTPEAGQEFATREARAEAVGALVRVADGAVLWQDHATATMTLQPTGNHKTTSLDRQAVEEAEHFALTELQRRFRAYRAHFEN